MSVTWVLPAAAMRPVGRARASASGVTMTAVAGSLLPQFGVQAFTARTWKVYAVPSVRPSMV